MNLRQTNCRQCQFIQFVIICSKKWYKLGYQNIPLFAYSRNITHVALSNTHHIFNEIGVLHFV